jgi:tetratricopeptide (TPR) repeat protein
LEINPGYAEACNNLGNVLMQKGRVDEAIIHFQKAVAIRPEYAKAHDNLGNALMQRGRMDEAILHFQKALEIRSDYPTAGYNLARAAWLLATSPEASVRDGAKAVTLAGQVERISGGRDAMINMTLAAAYAETGRFAEAIETAQRAQQLAVAQNKPALVGAIKMQMGRYLAGAPFRDASQTNAPAHPGPP